MVLKNLKQGTLFQETNQGNILALVVLFMLFFSPLLLSFKYLRLNLSHK